MPKSLLPKPTITVIAELVAAVVHVHELTPDTRPASIRDAVQVVIRTTDDEHRAMLIAIVMQAYSISLSTVDAIARELRAKGR